MKYIALLLLTGCQITIAKLPDPVQPDLAAVIKNHNDTIAVLVEDYKKRNEPKTEVKK